MDEVREALVWLRNNGNLNSDEFNVLSNYYEKNHDNIDVVRDELRSFYQNRESVLDKINSINGSISFPNENEVEIIDIDDFSNNNVQQGDVSSIINQSSIEQPKKRELVDVSDLSRDGKRYMKLNYSDGRVRIIENNSDFLGEELFSMLRQKYSDQSKYDVTVLFEEMVKDFIEVSLYDFSDISNKSVYDSLLDKEKQELYVVLSTYPGKKVFSGPHDNVYIVIDDGKESVVKVLNKDGVYQVRPFEEDMAKQDEDSSNSYSNQKSLGTHPAAGTHFSFSDKEAGFTDILIFIFLSGISIGIVFMIILNIFKG